MCVPTAVILQSRNTSFVGFLLHATNLNGIIVGRFINLPSNTQYSSCSNSQVSSKAVNKTKLNHHKLYSVFRNSTAEIESSDELTWQAPPNMTGIGPILFR